MSLSRYLFRGFCTKKIQSEKDITLEPLFEKCEVSITDFV